MLGNPCIEITSAALLKPLDAVRGEFDVHHQIQPRKSKRVRNRRARTLLY
jgi:hypothetical protein